MSSLHLATLIVGLLHIPLALTVWAMLHQHKSEPPLRLWVGGALVMGVGVTGFALRDQVPDWVSYELSYGLMTLSLLLRIGALRGDIALPTRWPALLALWAASLLAYSACVHSGVPAWRLMVGGWLYVVGTAFFARGAWRAGQVHGSRSGRVLAGVEGLFAAALALRLVMMALGFSPMVQMAASWDTVLVTITGMLAALYGNLGYLGLALDRSNARLRQARDAQLAETVRRETAESNAEQLRSLMGERDRLMHVLAHEIRQPLHNAGGALAAACEVLQHPGADGPGRATARLRRAQAVLDHMRSVLDNTLAATALLSRREPLPVQDTELDTLVDLTLGDILEARRSAIQVQRHTDLRSLELEFNLARLALRNLLHNALAHAGSTARVTLRIEEKQQPPTLVLAVCDDGPGLPALATAAGRPPGSGLGLSIVQQVMALHGGRLVLSGLAPHGTRAAMEFPLPASDEPEGYRTQHEPSRPQPLAPA